MKLTRQTAPRPRARLRIEPLEPRLLYSADLGPSLLAAPVVSPSGEYRLLDLEASPADALVSTEQQAQPLEIVFVDAATPEADRLIDDILGQAGGEVEIVRLDPLRDGLEQINAVLAGRDGIGALHIISHGSDGLLHLGAGEVTLQTVLASTAELEAWRSALTEDADILLYGCDVAASAGGRALVDELARLTGADVAASSNPTGTAALGGDFALEYSTGAVETSMLLAGASAAGWEGLLANSAPLLAGANDLATITEDAVANGGTLVADLIAGQVSDADAGALSGIALVGVDNSNGAWEYSLDGGTSWTAFGSPTEANARLLAADASTYVRFVPAADWSGSVTNGLSFRAWDLTSGVAGGTADTTTANATVSDSFSTASYSNNDGTALWSGSWVDADGNPSSGNITISGGQLVLATFVGTEGVYRQADLSAASSATLSFSFDNQLGLLLGTAYLQISSNGGASYTPLATFDSLNTGAGTYSADISPYLAANTRIQFVMDGLLLGGSFSVDNVQISYVVPLSGGSTAFSSAIASSSIVVAPVNDAPTGADSTVATLEDTAYVFTAGDFGFTDIDGNALSAVRIATLPGAGTLTNNGVAVAAGQFVSATDIAAGLLLFTPAGDTSGTGYASFTFQVQDDGGTANGGVDLDPTARTMTVDVASVNDSPTGADNTVATLEDTAYVFTAADFGFTDVDGNAFSAVRIATLPGAGTLTNNGVAVSAGQFISAPDIAAGLLLFTPAADASGTGYASFTFQVQDDGGTANGGLDLDPTARTMTVDVTSVNDAPAGANSTVATLEDTAYVFTAADFGFSDADGNSFAAVRITTLPGAGTLTNSGVALTAGESVSAADVAAGLLLFTPAAEASGTGYASFTFQVEDDGGTANGGVDLDPTARTMTVDVSSVNDAPAGASNTVTTLEDTAYVFTAADFGFADPDGNNFSAVRIMSLAGAGTLTNNGVAVSAGQFVSAADIAAGLLLFTPAADASGTGYASFTFQVQDDGGTANGGVDLDPTARTMMVDVTSVNDAPAGAGNTVTTLEDTAYVFTTADFSFSDVDGNSLSAVRITTLPGAGTLTNNGVAVTAGQFVSAADIAAGLLLFTPAVDASGTGYASFTFQVQDDGGTANGGTDLDPTARTMTLDVTSVNDAPSGADTTITTLEDTAYVFTAADFGFTDADGNSLSAVKMSTLPGGGTLTNNGIAVTAGQFVSAADIAAGLLLFTPATDASGAGYASFTFQVQDDGGTANGGVDLDPIARTMTVSVTAVNDAPSGADRTVATLENTAYVFAATDFGFSDADGNSFNAVQITTLPGAGTLTNNAVAVTAGQLVSAVDIAAGFLRFTPAADASGTGHASFTFQVQDDGGTANGGIDLDPAARTITIDVWPALAPSDPIAVPPSEPPPSASPVPDDPEPVQPAAPLSPPSEPAAQTVRQHPRWDELGLGADDALQLAVLDEASLARNPAFVSAQRLAEATRGNLVSWGTVLAPAAEDPLPSLELLGLPGAEEGGSAPDSSRGAGLVSELDRVRQALSEQGQIEQWISASIAFGSFGLTVGYVVWLLRGGALVASLLSSLPAWRLLDPLPVLARRDDADDAEDDDDAFVSFLDGEAAPLPEPERR